MQLVFIMLVAKKNLKSICKLWRLNGIQNWRFPFLKKERTGDCFYVCIKNLNRSYTITCSIKNIVIIHHICLEKKWIIHSAVGDSESENCIFLQCHIIMMV